MHAIRDSDDVDGSVSPSSWRSTRRAAGDLARSRCSAGRRRAAVRVNVEGAPSSLMLPLVRPRSADGHVRRAPRRTGVASKRLQQMIAVDQAAVRLRAQREGRMMQTQQRHAVSMPSRSARSPRVMPVSDAAGFVPAPLAVEQPQRPVLRKLDEPPILDLTEHADPWPRGRRGCPRRSRAARARHASQGIGAAGRPRSWGRRRCHR